MAVLEALSQRRIGHERARTERSLEAVEDVRTRPFDAVAERSSAEFAGRHVVGLATTSGMAVRLLINAERGFDVAYMDAYRERIEAVQMEDVQAAAAAIADDDRATVGYYIPDTP